MKAFFILFYLILFFIDFVVRNDTSVLGEARSAKLHPDSNISSLYSTDP